MQYYQIYGTLDDGVSKRPVQVDKDGKVILAPATSSAELKAYMVKGGTTSSVIDLGDHYRHLLVVIPVINTATLKLQVSLTHGGTYQNLSTATTASGVGSFNTTFNLFGWRYIKIVASAAQSSQSCTFSVQGVTF